METQPSRGRGLARRLVWFTIGFVVSWVVWSSVYYVRSRSKDITQAWPQELRELVPPEQDWMKDAVARTVGRIVVIAPADERNASAIIHPLPPDHFPFVTLSDEGPDGRLDSIMVVDASERSFSIDVADGKFKSFTCATRLGDDSVIYTDGNMDGEYDYRSVPGRSSMIMVNRVWRNYVQEGDTRFVDLDGRRTALKLIDGVWRIADDK